MKRSSFDFASARSEDVRAIGAEIAAASDFEDSRTAADIRAEFSVWMSAGVSLVGPAPGVPRTTFLTSRIDSKMERKKEKKKKKTERKKERGGGRRLSTSLGGGHGLLIVDRSDRRFVSYEMKLRYKR